MLKEHPPPTMAGVQKHSTASPYRLLRFLLASQREPRTIAQHLPCSQNSYPAPQGPWISKAQFLSPQFICLLNKCLLRAYWAPDIVLGRGDGGSMHRMGEGTEGPS